MGSNSSTGNQGGGGSRDSNRKAKKDLEVSAYEAAITKQNKGTKKEINKGLNITTSSNDNKRSGYKAADYNPEKDDTEAKMDLFKNQGATNIKNNKLNTPTTALLSGVFQKGSIKTRTMFTEKVLGKGGYKKTTKEDFERMSRTAQESMYKDYINNRNSGKTDAYGNTLSQGNDNNGNQVVQAPVDQTMPVEDLPQEVKAVEMTAEEAREKANLLLKKKRGKRLNKSLIATSPQGITNDKGLTLGKKSLLG
tara:strand:- start:243 stop:995 length:753 start_codon:yes stop_codon:yes gene_type:complete